MGEEDMEQDFEPLASPSPPPSGTVQGDSPHQSDAEYWIDQIGDELLSGPPGGGMMEGPPDVGGWDSPPKSDPSPEAQLETPPWGTEYLNTLRSPVRCMCCKVLARKPAMKWQSVPSCKRQWPTPPRWQKN